MGPACCTRETSPGPRLRKTPMHHEKHIQGSGRAGEAFGVRQASGAVRSTCARNPKRQRAAALQDLAAGRSFWSAPGLWRCSFDLRAKSKAAEGSRTPKPGGGAKFLECASPLALIVGLALEIQSGWGLPPCY